MSAILLPMPPPALSLDAAVGEAEQLLAQREGVHDMHNACALVRGYCRLAVEDGAETYAERVERILSRMRVCARTGFYPSFSR